MEPPEDDSPQSTAQCLLSFTLQRFLRNGKSSRSLSVFLASPVSCEKYRSRRARPDVPAVWQNTKLGRKVLVGLLPEAYHHHSLKCRRGAHRKTQGLVLKGRYHRRWIKTEEKAKVVAAACWAKSIKFLCRASYIFCTRTI